MTSRDLPRLLADWRTAEAAWERTPQDDPAIEDARAAVLRAWEAYNRAAGSFDTDEIVLVADNEQRYVAVFGPTQHLLGRSNAELTGKEISDVTPAEALAQMETAWRAFVTAGVLEGDYPLQHADGTILPTRFRARAHHPVNGLHVSRHWPVDPS